VPRTATEIN